jgi:DNA-binding transcriptional regulator YiaG
MRFGRKILTTVAALASLVGLGSVSKANTETLNTKNDVSIKADPKSIKRKSTSVVNTIGGIPIEHLRPNYGMSPKEYGQRYGTGKNRKHKSNRKRYAHNSKVSARNIA